MVPAIVGVAVFVDPADETEDREELESVHERLAKKRVQLVGAGKDRLPVPDEHADRPENGERPEHDDGRGPDPPDVFHRPVQESVRIENLELDEEGIESLGLLLGRALAGGARPGQQFEALLGG